MQKILEAFANGELRVEADISKRSPEHQKASKRCDELEEKVREKLEDEEGQKIFDELMGALAFESSYYAQERFIRGFRLGALMMIEVFSDPDVFLWRSVF